MLTGPAGGGGGGGGGEVGGEAYFLMTEMLLENCRIPGMKFFIQYNSKRIR